MYTVGTSLWITKSDTTGKLWMGGPLYMTGLYSSAIAVVC